MKQHNKFIEKYLWIFLTILGIGNLVCGIVTTCNLLSLMEQLNR